MTVRQTDPRLIDNPSPPLADAPNASASREPEIEGGGATGPCPNCGTHLPAVPPGGPTFSLAHNVRSKAEVDQILAQAQAAGATITDPARDRFWGGYSGYFQDPDGHLWDIAWNPELLPD